MKRLELSVFAALALFGLACIAGACRATHPVAVVAPVRVRPVAVVTPVIQPVYARPLVAVQAVEADYGYAGSAALVAPLAVQQYAAPLALNVGYGGGVAVVRQRFAVAAAPAVAFVGRRAAVIAPVRAAVVVPQRRVIFRR